MGMKQLYSDNLRKLPNEYGDVSVMSKSEGEREREKAVSKSDRGKKAIRERERGRRAFS